MDNKIILYIFFQIEVLIPFKRGFGIEFERYILFLEREKSL